jgi:hypothetical protein
MIICLGHSPFNSGHVMDTLQTGHWWRFSKYEVRDGVIFPAEGALCERYDPWKLFDRARAGDQQLPQGKRMAEPPYQQLFSLVRPTEGPKWAGGGVGFDVEAIIEWCSHFGLLGLLPHCAYAITLPARWTKTGDATNVRIWRKFNRLGPDELVPAVTRHVRQPTGWNSEALPFPPGTNVGARVGTVVDEVDLTATTPRPGVIWTNMTEVNPSVQALDKLLPFFGASAANGFECPMPLSSDFWEVYGEPVEQFFNAVLALYHAVATIARLGENPRELRGDDLTHLSRATSILTALAAPVSVSVSFSDDGSRLVQRWAGPSLLSSFAHMAVQDLTAGLVRSCANCNGVFVTNAWQGVYCSVRCRGTALKRSLRERQRTAIEMSRAGKSIKTIARNLGSEENTVKGWVKKLNFS